MFNSSNSLSNLVRRSALLIGNVSRMARTFSSTVSFLKIDGSWDK